MAYRQKGFPMHAGVSVSPMRNTNTLGLLTPVKDDPSNDLNYDPSFGAELFEGYDNNSSTTSTEKKGNTGNSEQGTITGDLSNVVPKTTSVKTDDKDSKIKTTDGSNLGDGLEDAKNADERKKLMEQSKKEMYANAWQNSGAGHIYAAGESIVKGIKNMRAKRKARKAGELTDAQTAVDGGTANLKQTKLVDRTNNRTHKKLVKTEKANIKDAEKLKQYNIDKKNKAAGVSKRQAKKNKAAQDAASGKLYKVGK